MANINASGAPVSNAVVTFTGVVTPDIINQTLAVADTEVSVALPISSKRFRICARGTSKIQLAYTVAESGTKYISIWPGAFYEEQGITAANITLYIQASQAGEVAEIVSWT